MKVKVICPHGFEFIRGLIPNTLTGVEDDREMVSMYFGKMFDDCIKEDK